MTKQPSSSLTFASALAAIDKERELREQGVSFRTEIVKTKKRGLEYSILLLNEGGINVGTV